MRMLCLVFAWICCAASVAAKELPEIPFQRLMLDPAHSTLTAQVSHLGIAPYTFGFDRFAATLDLGTDELHATRLTAEVDVASLDLPSPPEGFLAAILGANWLQADRFPAVHFASDGFDRTGPVTARMTGTMRLMGVEAPLTLHIRFHGGYASSAWEPTPRLGFTAIGFFDRSDFGMRYGLLTQDVDLGVGDRISFRVTAEFVALKP